MATDYEVPAIRRAHQILERLATKGTPVSAADLGQATGLPKSTLYLLLESLVQRRWIEKRSDGYLIGIGLYTLGASYLRHDALQEAFRHAAVEFVEREKEVLQLAVLDGDEVVYIAREDAPRPVRLVSELGSRLPAHACALGKALLAQLPEAKLQQLLPARLPAITEHTVTDLAQLLEQLREVRRSGVATEQEEVTAGLCCFAAYVGQTPSGKSIAVSTSIPVARLDAQRRSDIRGEIADVAAQMKKAIVG